MSHIQSIFIPIPSATRLEAFDVFTENLPNPNLLEWHSKEELVEAGRTDVIHFSILSIWESRRGFLVEIPAIRRLFNTTDRVFFGIFGWAKSWKNQVDCQKVTFWDARVNRNKKKQLWNYCPATIFCTLTLLSLLPFKIQLFRFSLPSPFSYLQP